MEARCREFQRQSNRLTGEGLTYGEEVAVVFTLPHPLPGDLFLSLVSVPVHEVSSWSRGFLPPGLRAGLVHEMRRQNLRQIDVASRVGLSRPQLTNALRGRFGVGPRAAQAIKAFVLEQATRL